MAWKLLFVVVAWCSVAACSEDQAPCDFYHAVSRCDYSCARDEESVSTSVCPSNQACCVTTCQGSSTFCKDDGCPSSFRDIGRDSCPRSSQRCCIPLALASLVQPIPVKQPVYLPPQPLLPSVRLPIPVPVPAPSPPVALPYPPPSPEASLSVPTQTKDPAIISEPSTPPVSSLSLPPQPPVSSLPAKLQSSPSPSTSQAPLEIQPSPQAAQQPQPQWQKTSQTSQKQSSQPSRQPSQTSAEQPSPPELPPTSPPSDYSKENVPNLLTQSKFIPNTSFSGMYAKKIVGKPKVNYSTSFIKKPAQKKLKSEKKANRKFKKLFASLEKQRNLSPADTRKIKGHKQNKNAKQTRRQ